MTKINGLNYLIYKARKSRYTYDVTYLDDEVYQHIDKKEIERLILNVKRNDGLFALDEMIMYIKENWKD